MNLLNLEKITKAYGERKLFDHADFYVNEGEKVGIIGINGTGKSTLLKIITGLEEPDEGSVTRARHLVIHYLPQHPVMNPEDTALSYILNYHQNPDMAEQVHREEAAQDEVRTSGIEIEAKTLLQELGIVDSNQKLGELSGGQKKKIALAAVFAGQADLLILDEPTNHLDLDMADWLERKLRKWKGSIVMVTHDRYFLDSVSNRIAELCGGRIYSYQTNYSGFLTLKTEREEMLLAGERKRRAILRNELAWVMRGARARSTKQKARLERYEELRNRVAPQDAKTVEMSSVSTRLGKTTIELSAITKAYGDRVLIRDFSYIFLKNDRVAFVGQNGCGKTTLMKIIEGSVKQDCGERVVGQTVKIGYYSQEIHTEKTDAGIAYMDPAMRVIDYIRNTAQYIRMGDDMITASQMLEKFLFEGEEQYGLIGKLSGGEKRRLNLLRVLMEAPNVLILDEPTNDLDVTTLTILEDYLDHFNGIVIFVSHDRYFLDRMAKRIFAFEGDGRIRQHEGNYTDYRIRKEFESDETLEEGKTADRNARSGSEGAGRKGKASASGKENADSASKSISTWKHEKKVKFTYREQREYETIEADIAALEERLKQLDDEMAVCASSYLRLTELTAEKEEIQGRLDEKMDRWMYLEELAAKIEAANQSS